jgi:hypothetical protein
VPIAVVLFDRPPDADRSPLLVEVADLGRLKLAHAGARLVATAARTAKNAARICAQSAAADRSTAKRAATPGSLSDD